MLLTQPQSQHHPTAKTNRRYAKIKWCEIVRVDFPAFLVNARQQACRYETEDGTPLAPGYYLTLWPAGVGISCHGSKLRYLGPFATKAEANWLQTSALGLGIVELEMEDVTEMVAVSSAPPPALHWQPLDLAADLVRVPLDGEAAYQGA